MGILYLMSKKIAECGTRSGYNRHARLGELACEPCKTANTEYYMEKYHNDPEYKERFLKNQYKRHKERMELDPDYAEKQTQRFHDNYIRRYEDPEFRQELAENQKRWVNENRPRRRELTRKHSHIRRAFIAGNDHNPYTEKEVLDLYGTDCHICNEPIDLEASRRVGEEGWTKSLHIDHLVPILKGGADTLENVRPAHGFCNISKGAKELTN